MRYLKRSLYKETFDGPPRITLLFTGQPPAEGETSFCSGRIAERSILVMA